MARFHLSILVPAMFAGALACVAPAAAQMSESELVMRINRLESQVRQLTGQNEELQYRNQQLEQQLSRLQQAGPSQQRGPAAPAQTQYTPPPQPQYGAPGPQYGAPQVAAAPPGYPQQQVSPSAEAYPPASARGRRGDAFDPNRNPNAPGAPRTLGNPGTVAPAPPLDAEEEPPYVGAPGGRQAGAPLDIATMSEEAAGAPPPRREVRQIPGALPPPVQPRGQGGQQMVMAPSNSPKDEYDLAYGYVLRKDYALAEESLRAFLKKHPADRLAPDANYWLGESLFQRQRYREAAEAFLNVSTKHESSAKAPDSLLRLGQSLAALKEKEAACATLGEIGRKYPRASANVKQAADREQKRVGC
jgi:tol-pal system protein YbgF